MGVGRICFRWGALADFSKGSHKDFSRGVTSGEILFFVLESEKTTFLAKNAIEKTPISKSRRPCPPFRRPCLTTLL